MPTTATRSHHRTGAGAGAGTSTSILDKKQNEGSWRKCQGLKGSLAALLAALWQGQ